MGERMLVVDDESSVLCAMRAHFSANGYEVDCARDLQSAQLLLNQQDYSVAIVDLRFNGLEQDGHAGLRLLEHMREQHPCTPTIVVTGDSSSQTETQVRKCGAKGLFLKPPPIAELTRFAATLSGKKPVSVSRGKVLVVDDNLENCELLKEILSQQDLEVFTANDGLRAVEVFKKAKPDLVLLDVQMPFIDGFEVCRQFKSDPQTRLTPVVLITALAAVEDRVRGIAAGADDFLTKPLDRIELLARVRSLLSLKQFTDQLEQAESIVFVLARSIEAKDPYTEGHCERLSDYASRLGERLRLPPEEIVALRRAGIVHDIGKVAVPDAILLKPSVLTREELAIMQQHTVVGERICAPLNSFRLVLPMIRSHHEKMDGSGYPDGLHAAQIPITVRILQVVDVYDALTTDRPYKRALSSSVALAIMDDEVKKGWWDIRVVAEFKMLISAKPSKASFGSGNFGKPPEILKRNVS